MLKFRSLALLVVVVFACCVFCTCDAKSSKADKSATPRVEPGLKWKCEDIRKCDEDYLRFAELAAKHADITMSQELDILGGDVNNLPPIYSDPIKNQKLREMIIDALNIDFLLKGMDKRPLNARVVEKVETKSRVKWRILLSDPFVGDFELLYFTPNSAGPHPAVVAAHGHGESAESFATDFALHQFPDKGYALAVPTFRVMGADEYEDRLVRRLMVRGFTLMGIRVYEILLTKKYLRSQDKIRKDRIGLLGHSEGGVTGNLAVRIDDGFAAYVCDCKGSYLGVYENRYLLDDYVPRLFRIHKQINDLTMTKTPTKKIPYARNPQWDSIFKFFDRFLTKP